MSAHRDGLSGVSLAIPGHEDSLPQMQVKLVTDPQTEFGSVWIVHCLHIARKVDTNVSSGTAFRAGTGSQPDLQRASWDLL